MIRYRKKPVVIDAFKWEGSIERGRSPEWVCDAVGEGTIVFEMTTGKLKPVIKTLEGSMTVELGDWIIKGVKEELYPCKPDIFEATYEAVEA